MGKQNLILLVQKSFPSSFHSLPTPPEIFVINLTVFYAWKTQQLVGIYLISEEHVKNSVSLYDNHKIIHLYLLKLLNIYTL